MIVIGPFALICILLLFFRPVRLLAGSVLLTLMVLAARLFGRESGEHIDVVATVLTTQILFWIAVIVSGHSKRKQRAREIADAINAGLAQRGIVPATTDISRDSQKDQDEKVDGLRIAIIVMLIVIPAIALVYWLSPNPYTNITPATQTDIPSSLAHDTAPITQASLVKKKHKRTIRQSIPTVTTTPQETDAPAMPMADPHPGSEPPQ